MLTKRFFGCNTAITLSCFGESQIIETALEKAQRDCQVYERMFSRTIPTSDIYRLNTARGNPIVLNSQTAKLLLEACNYCKISNGIFDITIGSVSQLWNFKNGYIPDKKELFQGISHVGWRRISVWNENAQWFARLNDPLAAVDLGGIAKGWIADRLAASLLDNGATGVIVDLGGNIVVRGKKPNESPWKIGIRDPRSSNTQKFLTTVELIEGSIVTSGVYERSFTYNDTLYHHILDPKTGMPASVETQSVSIVAKTSLVAEGFSTIFLVLGLEKSRILARSYPEVLQAYFIYPDNSIRLLYPEIK